MGSVPLSVCCTCFVAPVTGPVGLAGWIKIQTESAVSGVPELHWKMIHKQIINNPLKNIFDKIENIVSQAQCWVMHNNLIDQTLRTITYLKIIDVSWLLIQSPQRKLWAQDKFSNIVSLRISNWVLRRAERWGPDHFQCANTVTVFKHWSRAAAAKGSWRSASFKTLKTKEHWTLWASSGAANSAQLLADLKHRVESIILTEDGLVPLDLTDQLAQEELQGPAGANYGNKGVVVGSDGSLRKRLIHECHIRGQRKQSPGAQRSSLWLPLLVSTRIEGHGHGLWRRVERRGPEPFNRQPVVHGLAQELLSDWQQMTKTYWRNFRDHLFSSQQISLKNQELNDKYLNL